MERKRADSEYNRAGRLSETVNSQRAKLNEVNKLKEDAESLKTIVETEKRRADKESLRADNLQRWVNSLRAEVGVLEKRLSDSESLRSELVKELEEEEAQDENLGEALDETVQEIEERTDYVFDEADGSREEFIKSVVQRLLEDLEALKAEDEE